jgi:hypothetical protein
VKLIERFAAAQRAGDLPNYMLEFVYPLRTSDSRSRGFGADARCCDARSPWSTSTWAAASSLRFGRRSIQSRPQPITATVRRELSPEHERKQDG